MTPYELGRETGKMRAHFNHKILCDEQIQQLGELLEVEEQEQISFAEGFHNGFAEAAYEQDDQGRLAAEAAYEENEEDF